MPWPLPQFARPRTRLRCRRTPDTSSATRWRTQSCTSARRTPLRSLGRSFASASPPPYLLGMNLAVRRRAAMKLVPLDRSLEAMPLFRLSDSADDAVISFTTDTGGRWRVLPAPGDRLPGTFDQDVYVELSRRLAESEHPSDGALSFTLHSFLRSIDRRVDGRTYDQLRSALTRLERTTLESQDAYHSVATGGLVTGQF